MNRYLFVLLLISIKFGDLKAQQHVVFVDESWRLEHSISSDYSIAVADINGDYRDDIVRMNTDSLYFTLNIAQNNRFVDFTVIPKAFPVLSTNIADLDNDHHNEIIITGNKTGIGVYGQRSSELSFEQGYINGGDYYAQGSSIADLNLDGFLDYFIANDIGNNQVYLNDGNGILRDTVIDDFNILAEQGSSGNYNSSWLDADGDGDLDLYIAKCHINANSFDDPRRINQYFENQNGVYIERASALNLSLGDQSWCSSSGDLDNDGDPDIVLINHGTPILILENKNENGFVTHSDFTDTGDLIGDEQQVIVQDFNNDGLLDVFILGFNDQLLLNEGDFQFKVYNNPIGEGNAFSGACGDFNNDGWLDLYAVYGTADSGIDDKMWINFKLQNHFIKFSLNGKESNAQGIGAKIIVYGEWGSQSRWVTSGDSYGITNSMNLHFGLGNHSIVDSMHCIWPSGHVDRFYQLEIDRHYVLTESECIIRIGRVETSSPGVICKDGSVLLYANDIGETLWNNAIVLDTLLVDQSGYYFAESTSSCRNATGLIYVDSLPALEGSPILFAGDEIVLCEGDELILQADTAYYWNLQNSFIGNEISLSESGSYYCYVADLCDTIRSHEVLVDFQTVDNNPVFDTIVPSSEYWLNSGFVESNWYDSDFNFLEQADSLLVKNIEEDTLFYFSYKQARSFDAFDAGPEFHPDDFELHDDSLINMLSVEIKSEILLLSLDVIAGIGGPRKLLVIDALSDTVYSGTFNLNEGRNTLVANYHFNSGKYIFSFDSEVNMNAYGNISPKLNSNSNGLIKYPLSLGQYIKIVDDNIDIIENLYFYNWVFQPILEDCGSELIPYNIEVDTTLGLKEFYIEKFIVYPNPVEQFLILENSNKKSKMLIFDLFGRKLIEQSLPFGQHRISIEHLSSGIYNILLIDERNTRSSQFIKP